MTTKVLPRLGATAGPTRTPDGVVLTTGHVATLCGVAVRTVTNWCNRGLKHWTLPLSQDRRIYAHDLRAFLARHGSAVPSDLAAMTDAAREVILFRCPPAVAAAVRDHVEAGVVVREVGDELELGELFARRFAAGVVVVGPEAGASEARRVFSRVKPGWKRVHVYAPDQTAAAADAAFADGEAGKAGKRVAVLVDR